MIRKLQKADINRVADIWLKTNLKAHFFISEQYWISNYEFVKELLPQAEVYGGGLSPLRQALLDCGAEPVELFGTEPLTTHNAVPTAEGAIALAVLHSPYRLHGAPCLVIGYGHIGRVLANKLHGLSARVTVAARRPSDRAAAEALGLEADETGRYARGLAYHFVFNTVPAPVLTQDQLAALLPGCLLVELASAPGGIPACTRTDVTRIDAPGLPGRFCPASAGAAYAAAILEQEGAFPA